MNKKKPNYVNYITVFVIVTGLLLPYSTIAQSKKNSALPTIVSFKAIHKSTKVIKGNKGKWIELNWLTTKATNVKLYKNGVEIKGKYQKRNGSIGWPLSLKKGPKIQFNTNDVFELVAENDIGKTSRKLNQYQQRKKPPIATKPEILDFRVVQQTSKSQKEVKLYWKVKHALKVRLYDDIGEIEGDIELDNNTFGWPLSMPGAFTTGINKTTTYKLVAIGKSGRVTKSVKVYVTNKKCKLIISVTGVYNKHTDGIGIYKVTRNGVNKFLFKSPVSQINRQGQISYWSTIKLPIGSYFLAPYGGGKDKYGNFGVMYKPRNIEYNCSDGNTKNITIKADFAEY